MKPSQWWAHFPSHEEYRLLSQAHSFIRVGSTSNSLFCFILFCRYPPRSTLYDYCLLMSHLLWGTLISFWWYIYYALAFISLIKVSHARKTLLYFTSRTSIFYYTRKEIFVYYAPRGGCSFSMTTNQILYSSWSSRQLLVLVFLEVDVYLSNFKKDLYNIMQVGRSSFVLCKLDHPRGSWFPPSRRLHHANDAKDPMFILEGAYSLSRSS